MTPRIQIVVGLAFGDEGKGSIVDYLAHETPDAPLIVRFNGGAQAAHNVVTPDGKHHTFAQFGSGMFRPDATTHLSRFVLVNPVNMVNEANHLSELDVPDVLARTTIAASAPIITPYHRALNRLREMSRGDDRHGSCGQGIGELMADMLVWPEMVLHAEDLMSESTTRQKLKFWREYKRDQAKTFGPHPEAEIFNDDLLADDLYNLYKWLVERGLNGQLVVDDDFLDNKLGKQSMIFEGAQGVLLDENYGFNPYTTWSTTTPKNARELIGDHYAETIGVVRAYYTRHGPGPFPTEGVNMSAYSSLQEFPAELHNGTGEFQGNFRTGFFDEALFIYALNVCDMFGGVNNIALTFCDAFHVDQFHDVGLFETFSYNVPWGLHKNPDPSEIDKIAWTKSIEAVDSQEYGTTQSWRTITSRFFANSGAALTSSGPTRDDKEWKLLGVD